MGLCAGCMTEVEWDSTIVGVAVGEFGGPAVFGDDGDCAGGENKAGWRLDIGRRAFQIGFPSFEFLARAGALCGVGCACRCYSIELLELPADVEKDETVQDRKSNHVDEHKDLRLDNLCKRGDLQ